MSVLSSVPRADFCVHGLDHVQLAMPAGEEAAARAFYGGLLGLHEIPKPPVLAQRGGVWFAGGSLQLHLRVEAEFRAAKKAHPALLVRNLRVLVRHLQEAGVETVADGLLEGYERVYVADPFGNRLELLEPVSPLEEVEFAKEDVRSAMAQSLIAAMCAELNARYGLPRTPMEPADLALPGAAFVIARLGGEVAGCAGLRRIDDRTAEIKRMYVLPPARRRGIARRLLAEMERIAASLGYRTVQLETGSGQPEAIRLYESAVGYYPSRLRRD